VWRDADRREASLISVIFSGLHAGNQVCGIDHAEQGGYIGGR
jgi:hypothetical protein